MYIAYSALQTPAISAGQQPEQTIHDTTIAEIALRYQAYQTTCNKYSREIAAIQKHIPGWQPKFY